MKKRSHYSFNHHSLAISQNQPTDPKFLQSRSFHIKFHEPVNQIPTQGVSTARANKAGFAHIHHPNLVFVVLCVRSQPPSVQGDAVTFCHTCNKKLLETSHASSNRCLTGRNKEASRNKCHAISNKCHASSNRCLTRSNKKLVGTSATLLVTSATLVVTGALLVVTRS